MAQKQFDFFTVCAAFTCFDSLCCVNRSFNKSVDFNPITVNRYSLGLNDMSTVLIKNKRGKNL